MTTNSFSLSSFACSFLIKISLLVSILYDNKVENYLKKKLSLLSSQADKNHSPFLNHNCSISSDLLLI